MKVKLLTDGGFDCPDIVGKIVEAEWAGNHYNVPHSELCRVSKTWEHDVGKEDAEDGIPTPSGFGWIFYENEVEVKHD